MNARDRRQISAPRDLTGLRLNHLTVLREGPRGTGRQRWVVRCQCGGEMEVSRSEFLNQTVKSCGCYRREHGGNLNRSHSRSKTPEWHTWQGMIRRCEDSKAVAFDRYGGRGISVCTRWRESFPAFLEDMGLKPTRGHTIDRADNSKGYWCGKLECPDCGPLGRAPNCRWATQKEQQRNRSSNVILVIDDVARCAVEWSEISGVRLDTILRRVDRGWSEKDAVFTPVCQGTPNHKNR